MTPLIQSLEAAEGGSREFDIALGQALGIIDADLIYTIREGLRVGRGNCEPWPRWTTSLDAALALAERVLGTEAALTLLGEVTALVVTNARKWTHRDVPRLLCIAILRAREGADQ